MTTDKDVINWSLHHSNVDDFVEDGVGVIVGVGLVVMFMVGVGLRATGSIVRLMVTGTACPYDGVMRTVAE